jgi:hypothetical protein
MVKKSQSNKIRYPDARLTGVDAFFELVKSEPDWRPNPITKYTLKALGIAKGKETNLLFTLRFLGIIDQEGAPTKEFDLLRKDFPSTLKRLVRSSYSLLFETIPASRISQTTLVGFFRTHGYSEETAEYQAKLFVKLCSDAGIDLPNVEPAFKRARYRKRKPSTP